MKNCELHNLPTRLCLTCHVPEGYCDFGGCHRRAVTLAAQHRDGVLMENRAVCGRCQRFARDLGYTIAA